MKNEEHYFHVEAQRTKLFRHKANCDDETCLICALIDSTILSGHGDVMQKEYNKVEAEEADKIIRQTSSYIKNKDNG